MSDGRNGQQPFFPVGFAPQQPAASQPQYQSAPAVAEDVRLFCDHCETEIEHDEPTVDISAGRARYSPKTGRLLTMDADTNGPPVIFTMHRLCAMEYVMENISPDQADEMLWSMVEEQAEEMAEEMLKDEDTRARLERRLADPRS